METISLNLADGWNEIPPRDIGIPFVRDDQHHLLLCDTTGNTLKELGNPGAMDTPIVVDSHRQFAYRYACQMRTFRGDFSEIRAFDLSTGKSRTQCRLRVSEWVPWMLAPLPGKNMLVGLLASDYANNPPNIRHQFGFFDLKQGKCSRVTLAPDSFYPLALSTTRHEALFQGAAGIQRVHFKGQRLNWTPLDGRSTGKGATYHPNKPQILVGGSGLRLWDFQKNTHQRLTEFGMHPVWARHGTGAFYCESSADLYYYDRHTDVAYPLLQAAQSRHVDSGYARPLTLSKSGQYGIVPLALKQRLSGPELAQLRARTGGQKTPQRDQLFRYTHTLCVMDFNARELWQVPGKAKHITWVE